MSERFFLSQDNSSHWYLVPVSQDILWEQWRNIPEDDERSWVEPEFAKRIDGPHRLTFTDPKEG